MPFYTRVEEIEESIFNLSYFDFFSGKKSLSYNDYYKKILGVKIMIDKKHLDYLTSIVGEENIKSDKAHLIAFCYDATRTRFEPDAVVFPRHEQDVSQIF
jgi:hypothetical protein